MLEYSFKLCQTKFSIYGYSIWSSLQPSPEFIAVQTKITLICWHNHPSCENVCTLALKIPLSNVICTSEPPSKLWMLACLLLLEGMKRRFVFISRFSIAGGLVSSAIVQFPVCMSVGCSEVRECVSMCLQVGAHILYWYWSAFAWVYVFVHLYICPHLCVSALAWRRLYRHEQNSLVESSYQSHVRGGEGERRW